MQLSYPKLSLPDSEETIAFRAVDTILRSDPTLSAATQLMLSWRGEIEDLWEPALSTCPFLRISPAGGESYWENEGQHKSPLLIEVSAAVVGSDSDQICNYWGAIRRALWPQNNPTQRDIVHAATQAAGINRPTLSRPAYSLKVDDKTGTRFTYATGTITCNLLINTP